MLPFRIEKLDEVTSTNTLLLARANDGEPEGLVLLANSQTAGHGKLGRKWISPAGKNLLFSILLRPPIAPSQSPMLTQIACRAVADVLEKKYAVSTRFKKPNDVMFGEKKLCGTLVEALSTSTKLDAVVIGIGLNVNADLIELPPAATSMKAIKGASYDLDEVLRFILEEIRLKVVGLYKNMN